GASLPIRPATSIGRCTPHTSPPGARPLEPISASGTSSLPRASASVTETSPPPTARNGENGNRSPGLHPGSSPYLLPQGLAGRRSRGGRCGGLLGRGGGNGWYWERVNVSRAGGSQRGPSFGVERSLEALSLECGATGAGARQPGGRRATIATALELEGSVRREGLLTHFVASNLQRKIQLSAPAASPIPPVDPAALRDLVALAGQVAAQVDELLRSVHCGLQALTALSVGCIQTYRDGVESLGEAVDTSIRAMYTLVARCEELDLAMQPVPALARRIRDMKGTLERLEGLCK
uniref:BLOC-1-related complex subunit 6 C-terminal helix domain-containing protein n=1 Tax=Chelonoidis abingdonii TaxID=106734 RepID=A0A8C0QM82_CHEAB